MKNSLIALESLKKWKGVLISGKGRMKMAEKRMFTKKIVDSDAFLDMPLSTQALYFHLNMRADDDGFINNPKKIQRMIGASEDDLKVLIAKRFVICFENGVIVIKHWRMHNTLRKDRYNPTTYQEQLSMLDIKDNNSYTEKAAVAPVATAWQPDGNQMEPQYSIGKYSIDKDSILKDNAPDSVEPEQPAPKKNKPVKHKYGEYKNVLLTNEELEKLNAEYEDLDERIERLSSYVASTGKTYKSHYATIRNWARKDAEQQKPIRQEVVPSWIKNKKPGFNDFMQQNYDIDEIEREMLNNGEGFEERKEALQNRLKEKYGKGRDGTS